MAKSNTVKTKVVKKTVIDVFLRVILVGSLATAFIRLSDVIYNKTFGKKFTK